MRDPRAAAHSLSEMHTIWSVRAARIRSTARVAARLGREPSRENAQPCGQ